VLGFNAIAREAHRALSRWASGLGFASVWLVGPQTELTWRIDLPPQEAA
jgi:hypothetical protein